MLHVDHHTARGRARGNGEHAVGAHGPEHDATARSSGFAL